MKKYFSAILLATVLALGSTAALADSGGVIQGDHHLTGVIQGDNSATGVIQGDHNATGVIQGDKSLTSTIGGWIVSLLGVIQGD